jgi:hypothetical protein
MGPQQLLELRLDHAWNIRSLYVAQSRAYFASHPYRVYQEVDPQTADLTLRMKINAVPPAVLGLLFGDCIHNIRAVLDNLIWHIGIRQGSTHLHRLAFPIAQTQASWTVLAQRRLAGLSPGVVQAVGSLQPYHRGAAASTHPLTMLDRLWNDDKHHTTRLVLSYLHGARFDFVGAAAAVAMVPQDVTFGPVHDGSVLARFPSSTGRPVLVEATPRMQIALSPGLSAEGQRGDTLLADLYRYVRFRLLPRFRPFLS